MSTWPAVGRAVVEKGVVYAAAGIARYDGTHVCALDALTGEVRWDNDSSGELSSSPQGGIGFQANLYLRGGQLRFPGGKACGEASYDLRTGRWGPAVDREGRIFVWLEDSQMLAFR